MTPSIQRISEKILIGKRLTMSFAANRTFELWSSFMPRRKEIGNATGNALYSLQVYDPSFSFVQFDAEKTFEKWAAVEVTDHTSIPEGMECFVLSEGLYAVFIHKGPASDGPKTFQYIFQTWLPASPYALDNRPHFELLGEKYKHEDPDSEEEIWIPIRPGVSVMG